MSAIIILAELLLIPAFFIYLMMRNKKTRTVKAELVSKARCISGIKAYCSAEFLLPNGKKKSFNITQSQYNALKKAGSGTLKFAGYRLSGFEYDYSDEISRGSSNFVNEYEGNVKTYKEKSTPVILLISAALLAFIVVMAMLLGEKSAMYLLPLIVGAIMLYGTVLSSIEESLPIESQEGILYKNSYESDENDNMGYAMKFGLADGAKKAFFIREKDYKDFPVNKTYTISFINRTLFGVEPTEEKLSLFNDRKYAETEIK